jgi:hypothetical protein
MKIEIRRFFDEFFLYSSQFLILLILMLLISPAVDAIQPASLVIVTAFLIIQILLLVGQGHKPMLRILFSLITPAVYTLMRMIEGKYVAMDMANSFVWCAAFYVGLFQAAALSFQGSRVKRVAEVFLAFGAVLMFIFFYFYLDLRLGLARLLAADVITRDEYAMQLGIRSFGKSFLKFLATPQNEYIIFGVTTFGIFLLASKMNVLTLRKRIAGLFGAARVDEKVDEPSRSSPPTSGTLRA